MSTAIPQSASKRIKCTSCKDRKGRSSEMPSPGQLDIIATHAAVLEAAARSIGDREMHILRLLGCPWRSGSCACQSWLGDICIHQRRRSNGVNGLCDALTVGRQKSRTRHMPH
ncbi:hypothetical protein M758_9G098400 [Ceratodon purpureus]|nr:hypothetical protein M758_9G098400 [Ceratodon purpureus]